MKKLILLILITAPMNTFGQQAYDLQGHRGARGLMPENTIPAMIKALDLGVNTLELDLAITKDGEVIVTHEPYMNPVICLTPSGEEITAGDKSHNIYKLSYAEVSRYDVGTKVHKDFPNQVKFHTTKPRLADLFEVVEKYVNDHDLPKPKYNIEIKSSPEGDDTYHPGVKEFSDLVFQVIDKYISWDRINVQSFDFRILRYYHETYPDVVLAVLVPGPTKFEAQLVELGFQPQIYSPHYNGLTKEIVNTLHGKGLKVIPWTVNSTSDMQSLLDMGVDGIITDYPNLAPQR
ncbi:glycerophosphodiester phosphodiesterase [Belliella sp. DSM 111904]|uniref:Glycerophosphodiester phosphodiesterase n=1 Tax=Belliella filtrata TaxID=2923435 RepID=A0ABS9V5R0_9BACT|nr:glycerophosphodiester phosphodiesterase family protein [Belliella filtrata]MCH7411754.1 glycerophosphodiester phosphodiesterase [Belliella filtrata]